MKGKNQRMTIKVLSAKIIAPILIVMVIIGIWFVKNEEKQAGLDNNISINDTDNGSNPDFDLHVTAALDLEQLKSYRKDDGNIKQLVVHFIRYFNGLNGTTNMANI